MSFLFFQFLLLKNLTSAAPSFGPLVLVVAATNRPDLIDPALLRPGRFDKLIAVPPLDISGRKELLEICSKSIPFHPDVNFMEVAKVTDFYSGADLVNLCREVSVFAEQKCVCVYLHSLTSPTKLELSGKVLCSKFSLGFIQ